MRIYLIILIPIIVSGCISADYKSGNYRVLEEQSTDPIENANAQCPTNKIRTNGATASSSQIIAPYFIPLFHLSQKPDKEIIVTIENKNCPDLSIKSDDKGALAYTANSLNSEHCYIYITQPKHANKITINASNPKHDCENFTIQLVKKSFFCVRQTEFGGSPGCEKSL
ncbi:hypothetical protein [Stutzerimonas zhaodongensis]|uniref:hypothetical protein n=1 Tax=Stutzerimonas zhaodongensis TaxID=1176257 RepID=UPI001F4E2C82|nr:hypothetical protein [Stutzerimonas zhaodongensis]UNG17868.1 hypothetical protein MKP10_19005 [Stutzerimonas zhaodongensis]